jgi:hypothetical protein
MADSKDTYRTVMPYLVVPASSIGTGLHGGSARRSRLASSGLSTLNEDQIAERGARTPPHGAHSAPWGPRMARRDDREYREYLKEEQRSQPGCPARELVLDQRGQATRAPRT